MASGKYPVVSTYDSYDFQRAEFELDMARKAADPAAMRLHQELAARYLDRFTAPAAGRAPRS